MNPSYFSLTYIYHDCFILETEQAVFIFDFWKDPLSSQEDRDFPPIINEINPQKSVYFLVSHHHKDHFSRRIFFWAERFPRVRYVVSPDVYQKVKFMLKKSGVYKGPRVAAGLVTVLSPGESYSDECVSIHAFPSTDLGNSYAIESSGRKFFHAGDLNAWLWIDESSVEEVEEERNNFVYIVEEIKNWFNEFDLVMFPVDSRLGREYWWGAAYFLRQIRCAHFVPMHFELVLDAKEKEQRRIDAAAFDLFARLDCGEYIQLSSTRSRFLKR